MAYPILTHQSATKAFEYLTHSIELPLMELEALRGSGVVRDYYELKEEIDSIATKYSTPFSDGSAAKYEGEVGIVLHENLADSDATSDPDFWRWMSFRPLLDATLFRHGGKDKHIPAGPNFGLGSLLENFAFRAWMRAEIGYDSEAAPSQRYVLAMRGDQDLWRSHLIRVRYSFHREMAHALITFQHPDDSNNGVLKKGDKDDGIRMLAKRLQRTQANMVYPLLSKEQCLWLISELAQGLTKGNGEVFTTIGTT